MWPIDVLGLLHGSAGWYCNDPHGVADCVYIFWSRSPYDQSCSLHYCWTDGATLPYSWEANRFYGVAKIFLIFVLTFHLICYIFSFVINDSW